MNIYVSVRFDQLLLYSLQLEHKLTIEYEYAIYKKLYKTVNNIDMIETQIDLIGLQPPCQLGQTIEPYHSYILNVYSTN